MGLFKNTAGQVMTLEVLDDDNRVRRIPCAPGHAVEIPDHLDRLVPSHCPAWKAVSVEELEAQAAELEAQAASLEAAEAEAKAKAEADAKAAAKAEAKAEKGGHR